MKRTRGILTMAAVLLATPVQAQARVRHHHHHRHPAAADVQPALGIPGAAAWFAAHAPRPCPAGVPVQAITLVDQTGQSPTMLLRVERAIVDQSMQVRAAWGTPCVTFAPNGWRIYLKVGPPWSSPNGWHANPATISADGSRLLHPPYAIIYTAGSTAEAWSSVLSHEIVEMLIDPYQDTYAHGGTIGAYDPAATDNRIVEPCDPLEGDGYSLDGVYLARFEPPSFYGG